MLNVKINTRDMCFINIILTVTPLLLLVFKYSNNDFKIDNILGSLKSAIDVFVSHSIVRRSKLLCTIGPDAFPRRRCWVSGEQEGCPRGHVDTMHGQQRSSDQCQSVC